MDRPRRDSRQHNGITVRHTSQLTFATKSAISGLMHRSKGLFDDLVGQREQLIRDFQVKRHWRFAR
jgi:hypothetical protein